MLISASVPRCAMFSDDAAMLPYAPRDGRCQRALYDERLRDDAMSERDDDDITPYDDERCRQRGYSERGDGG